MSDPRYRPQDLAVDHRTFGTASVIWKSLGEVAELHPELTRSAQVEALLLSAQIQHNYVVRIRGRMKAKRLPVKAYADLAGVSYSRMLNVMRGAALLRIEDLGMADLILGQVTEFAVADAALKRAAEAAAVDKVAKAAEADKAMMRAIYAGAVSNDGLHILR